jgi:hypothetical protein
MKGININMDMEKLSKLLGSKQYENPFSFIQETAQNAIDSHRSIRSTAKIKIGFDDNFYTVRDFGKSFDGIQDFEKKVCTLLYSDKSENKTQDEFEVMGKWGIGSISPSRYLNQGQEFNYTVYKNGKEFTCYLSEVDGKGLVYRFTDVKDTLEPDGVLLKVPFNKYQGSTYDFIDKLKDKLAYFENITFELNPKLALEDNEAYFEMNKNEIVHGESFAVSRFSNKQQMHILLDQYIYPIDFEYLDITPIQIPIALKFKMGEGIEPNVTRERLFLTEEYKEVVLQKINKAHDELKKRTLQLQNITDPIQFINVLQSGSLEVKWEILNKTMPSLEVRHKYKDKWFKEGTQNALVHAFNHCFSPDFELDNTWTGKLLMKRASLITRPLNVNNKVVYSNTNYKQYEKQYLKEEGQNNKIRYIVKTKSIVITKSKYYHFKKIVTTASTHDIRSFIDLVKDVFNSEIFIKREDLKIPQYKKVKTKSYSKNKTKITDENDVFTVYEFRKAHVGGGSAKDAKTSTIAELKKSKRKIYYAPVDENYVVGRLSKTYHNTRFITVSAKVAKKLDTIEFKNVNPISKFMEGDFPAVRKYLTATNISERVLKMRDALRKGEGGFRLIMGEDLADKIDFFSDYVKNNRTDDNYLLQDLIKIGKEKNIADYVIEADVEETYKKFQKINDYLPIFPIFDCRYIDKGAKDQLKQITIDHLKFNHIRIDRKYYNIKDEETGKESLES